MRRHLVALATALAALSACASANGQTPPTLSPEQSAYRGPDLAAQRAAMDRLTPLVGEWQGPARLYAPRPGDFHQTEHVARDLDGLALVVHGVGYESDDLSTPIFRALAVISYDDRRQLYEFRTYNDGRAVTATANFIEDGRFRWQMEFPGALIRYTTSFDAETWQEIGEMSRDGGATWTRLVELNLTRP